MALISKLFFASLTVYFTVAALIGLFGFDLSELSCFLKIFLIPYHVTIEPPFGLIKGAFNWIGINIPNYLRGVFVIWIGLGRIVRKSISDIAAELEEQSKKYNSQPRPKLIEAIKHFARAPVATLANWFRKPAVKEGAVATIFWPYRLWVDLRGDYTTYRKDVDGQLDPIEVREFNLFMYWGLSPKKVLFYLAISFLTMAALVALNSLITSACS